MINNNKSESLSGEKEYIFFLEFLNFLEVFIHTVLYVRNVYPKEAFFPCKEYELSFLKYIPDLEIIDYINNFLSSLEILLRQNCINKISILIINKTTNKIIEIFDIEFKINLIFFSNKNEEEYFFSIKNSFQSVLYDFYFKFINIKENATKINKIFNLCIETKKEGSIINSKSIYNNMQNVIINKYIHNLILNNFLSLSEHKKCTTSIIEEDNFKLLIEQLINNN